MTQYFVALNEGSNNYGIDTELIRRTGESFFIVSPNTDKHPVRFFHLRERLGDATTPLSKIAEILLTIPGYQGKNRTGYYQIAPLQVPLGYKIGRISRPVHGWGGMLAFDEPNEIEKIYEHKLNQTLHIYKKLVKLGNKIDICEANFSVFGNEITDLITISCMHIESLFKFLLYEDVIRSRGRMTDFWKGSSYAKLASYELVFPELYSLGQIKPFAQWAEANGEYVPLPWYQAYNNVKHNAIGGNRSATLADAVHAIAACMALINSIHKPRLRMTKSIERIGNLLKDVFSFTSQPTWSAGERYWKIPTEKLRFYSPFYSKVAKN